VKEIGRRILKRWGEKRPERIAKMHFKTVQRNFDGGEMIDINPSYETAENLRKEKEIRRCSCSISILVVSDNLVRCMDGVMPIVSVNLIEWRGGVFS